MKYSFSNNIYDNNKKKIIIIILSIVATVAIVLGVVFGAVMPAIEDGKQITRLNVSRFPKLEYYVGDNADFSGLTIAVTHKNGHVEYVEYNLDTDIDFNFSGFNSSRATTQQKITISYRGFTCAYYIAVKEIPTPAPVLESISIETMPKTEYKVGEWLNTEDGLLKKIYSDGSFAYTIIINQYISGWSSAVSQTAGTYVLTVNYSEGGVLKKTTYTITVSE